MSRSRIQRVVASITIADGETVGADATNSLHGVLKGIHANVPQLDGTTTVTVAITDADGFTVFSKAAIAENAKTPIYVDANNQPLSIPVSGNHTITVTASGAQSGGNDTVVVTLLVQTEQ